MPVIVALIWARTGLGWGAGSTDYRHFLLALFWINTGPYNNLTARKFLLKLDAAQLREAMEVAQRNGADFRLAPGETIGALVEKYAPMFFDPNVEPMVTCKTPGEGQDILASSANNFYRDVTMEDLEGFQEQNQLNSRVVKRDGKIVEEVYKVGGLYDFGFRHDPDKPLESLADYCLGCYTNLNFPQRIDMICRYIEEYQADGLLINSIKSCNSFSAGQLLILREVEKRTGKPAAFIETDLVDPRYFSAANVKNRLESYFQMIEQKRAGFRGAA